MCCLLLINYVFFDKIISRCHINMQNESKHKVLKTFLKKRSKPYIYRSHYNDYVVSLTTLLVDDDMLKW